MQKTYRNITYLSDRSGTGMWRKIWPFNLINCVSQQADIQADYSQTPILDQNYYNGMNSVTIQRWISDSQCDLVKTFLKPLMDNNHGWLIYEIDDAMGDSEIPLYNRGRKAFEGEKVQNNIKQMLNAADFVTVTTDYIKKYYNSKYEVKLENIISIPNFLPRYLFGDRYNSSKKVKQFIHNKNKPRIGIISSLSHFNVDNVHIDKNGFACRKQLQSDGSYKWINENGVEVLENETQKITDDFDEIANLVRSTINDFQWVCAGYAPPQVRDLIDSHKIEYYHGVSIFDYASIIDNLQLQAIVAPIKKIEFNFCKSFIKYMECSAIGVPCFATNSLPYNRVMPHDQLFNDENQLRECLLRLKALSTDAYKALIEDQWKWLNTPCHEGDFNIKNFWLEDNLNIFIDLMRLKPKTIYVSLKSFIPQYEQRNANNSVIYKSDNGVEILR